MIYDRWWGPRDLISNGFGQRRREGGREEVVPGRGHTHIMKSTSCS